jgi:excisionase family DNA binding protein
MPPEGITSGHVEDPGDRRDEVRELTVREFAALERVTERTVYRWIEDGAVEYRRTPGGGIRILDRRRHERVQTSPDKR